MKTRERFSIMFMKWLVLLSFCWVYIFSSCQSSRDMPRDLNGLQNFVKFNGELYSGGTPDNEEAFKYLKSLGVKSILSVDGTEPQLALAKKYGMRYYHVPVSYGVWGEEDCLKIFKVFHTTTYPLYVHCHHGKHRAPTAMALGRLLRAEVTNAQAGAEMIHCGTSPYYKGLYGLVEKIKVPSTKRIDQVQEIPEMAELDDIQRSMATIDEHWDLIKESVKKKRMVSPAMALLLKEGLVEMGRLKEVKEKPEKFQKLMTDSIQQSSAFEKLTQKKPQAPEKIKAQFDLLKQSCVNCHKKYRD